MKRYPILLLATALVAPVLAQPVLVTVPTTIQPNDTMIGGVPLASAQITVQATTLTLNGRHSVASMRLQSVGATPAILTHSAGQTFSYGAGDTVNGFHLSVAGDFLMQSAGSTGASVDLNGKGFTSTLGPAPGIDSTNGGIGGTGGGHGGSGASSLPFVGGGCYDSIVQPVEHGSGGGRYVGNPAGAGGGCARISVGGTFTISGAIEANGVIGVSSSGCGAGGSLWLSAANLAGDGAIAANGGQGSNYGGGGGGRIALYYTTRSFTGSTSARGGASAASSNDAGGAGTIYIKRAADTGSLTIQNIAANLPAPTLITSVPAVSPLHVLTSADVIFATGASFAGDVTVDSAAVLRLNGVNTIAGSCVLGPSGASTLTSATPQPLMLTVNGACTVHTASRITLDGLGHAGDSGPGAGTPSNNGAIGGTGGGHGGTGASSPPFDGGIAYDSIASPSQLGSGGGRYVSTPAGAGGGALRLVVQGGLIVDGTISADGLQPSSSSGSGAGGAIWITSSSFNGAGLIAARGANGGGGWGAGGGGRIALYYDTSLFIGLLRAQGGLSAASSPGQGGAGTIYVKRTSEPYPTLSIVNGTTTPSAGTPITSNLLPSQLMVSTGSNVRFDVAQSFPGEVIILNSSRVQLSGSNSIAGSLTILGTGSTLTHARSQPLILTVGGLLSVGASSSINASGMGFDETFGTGAGTTSNDNGVGGAGGAHGGNGATSGVFAGGTAYGDADSPTTMGSGGGRFGSTPAGAGGGAFKITVTGGVTLNGTIDVSGAAGAGPSGAGAGGSIWLIAPTLTGAGSMIASGSNSNGGWGGGGGGRIAVYSDVSGFSGQMLSNGGLSDSSSNTRGGAGIILVQQPLNQRADLRVTNIASSLPAATPFTTDLDVRSLIVSDGAYVRCAVGQTVENNITIQSGSQLEYNGDSAAGGDLLVEGSSRVFPVSGQIATISVGGNATIDANSSIDASRRGFPGTQGPGAGATSNNGGVGGAGGGYGGDGADAPPFLGGNSYGDASQPVELGSGGGQFTSLVGGIGGGHIRLTVDGTLTLNGLIAADGGQGASASGSGSGGSIYITAGGLVGAGRINAGGANGGGNAWGAGGGGRIAVYSCNITLPIANLSAPAGSSSGQQASPGTIYFGASSIVFTEQPAGIAVNSGGYLQLGAVATGNGVVSYQWRRRNAQTGIFENLTEGQDDIYFGVNDSTLFIQAISCSGGGDYDCLACDSCGCFPSDIAYIQVDLTGDYNRDGGIDGADVDAFFVDWSLGLPGADVNQDGGVDGADVEFFFPRWSSAC